MSSSPSVDGAISSVIAARQAAIQSQIQFAVAAKALDAQKQQGQAAADLIETAAQIGKSVGKGEAFDGQA